MKIGIVGLGLIGGSLAWDLQDLNYQVIGVSRKESTCNLAVEMGIVSAASTDLDMVKTVDVVFICTPLGAIASTTLELIPHLRENTIVTDAGSAKGAIVSAITPHWHNFVGGHPMAGKEESGLKYAQKDLFRHNPYVLTPTEVTPQESVAVVTEIVAALGAKLYQCSPEIHDRAVSWISHLPAMVSASLIATCLKEPNPDIQQLARQVASSGFKDTSRVGGGNPELRRMMAEYNREELLRSLYQYQETLGEFISLIESENWDGLHEVLVMTQRSRPEFLNHTLEERKKEEGRRKKEE
ncbi:prephenate/arogenate dehydrogenase [Merismopedia glauca]|uniref:Arogenate dehydrogenase n=1 Tax=Merismopedia glauca CCAP 1448/3 TaxID=1296344 RepID=A0A2T1C964_9CYAN|nr:prephenate/arogenate dehydrogenase [Merismopedia glauca]PSB04815.1 arogenate dehydrogenase [Merismopedia glauca CCAP 1448/3]